MKKKSHLSPKLLGTDSRLKYPTEQQFKNCIEWQLKELVEGTRFIKQIRQNSLTVMIKTSMTHQILKKYRENSLESIFHSF